MLSLLFRPLKARRARSVGREMRTHHGLTPCPIDEFMERKGNIADWDAFRSLPIRSLKLNCIAPFAGVEGASLRACSFGQPCFRRQMGRAGLFLSRPL